VGSGGATKDPYTFDIQNRVKLVNNAVLGVIDAQGKQPAYKGVFAYPAKKGD
jgi:hypothetical protein